MHLLDFQVDHQPHFPPTFAHPNSGTLTQNEKVKKKLGVCVWGGRLVTQKPQFCNASPNSRSLVQNYNSKFFGWWWLWDNPDAAQPKDRYIQA